MPSVAAASCLSADGGSIFPDPDLPLLDEALRMLGIDATAAAWEDSTVDWSSYDLVVVRSTWTSVDQPERYLKWLTSITPVVRVENQVSLIEWNLDKRHLLDLEAAGIPVVPTVWVTPDHEWRPPAKPFVVKPAVSGGGRETALYTSPNPELLAHVRRLQAAGTTVMVQHYVESIAVTGETKMVHIDGQLSHAVKVGPLLEPDEGVLDRPWEKPVTLEPVVPTPAEAKTAERLIGFIEDRFGRPLYGRVDTCMIGDEPAILEIEFIDPSLFLWADKDAPGQLAAAIAQRLA